MTQIRPTVLLGVLAIALQSALPVRAQTIPPGAYGALRWRLVGPHRGGRVLAVAGVPGDPTTFYFGAVDGGVWRTRNAGVTWEPLFDDQPIASIGALALAPSDPNEGARARAPIEDRKSTRLNSSHVEISYAVFCLKKKKNK